MRKRTFLKLVEYQTEQSRKHLEEVRSIHTEMRGYKHDFHHHLQTLRSYLASGDMERALNYIDELDENLQNVDTLLKTGNTSADAILSAKIAQAKAHGIDVNVKAFIPDKLLLTDVELGIVIGNLLDNAIEACETVPERAVPAAVLQNEGEYAVFFDDERIGEEAGKARGSVCVEKGGSTRVRTAARGEYHRDARRLDQVQQRGRRVYVGVSGTGGGG